MMKRVLVFGTSYLGRLVYVYLSKDSPYEVAAFTLNEAYIAGKEFMGLDVIPFETIEEVYPPDQYSMFVAV